MDTSLKRNFPGLLPCNCLSLRFDFCYGMSHQEISQVPEKTELLLFYLSKYRHIPNYKEKERFFIEKLLYMIKTVFPINFFTRFFITVYNMASWYCVQKIRKNMQICPQSSATGNHFSQFAQQSFYSQTPYFAPPISRYPLFRGLLGPNFSSRPFTIPLISQ